MKIWKHKILSPHHGICTVKEASDKESTGLIAPFSHGFVNLYKGRKWVSWCGTFWAEKRIIKPKKKRKARECVLTGNDWD